jgi:hypothetical protein
MAPNNNTYEQVYNIREDASIATEVAIIICVLVQRGLLVAGFSSSKELLTMHYTGYNKNKPVWEVSFFENLFIQEPLLTDKVKVKGVFLGGNKNLIVPDALYDEKEAKHWLSRIHFIEKGDIVNAYPLQQDKARYLLATPVHISELVKINYKKAVTLPLPIYQFTNTNRQGLCLQCLVTAEEVSATLHNDDQLLWHRVFDYTNGDDIAYSIRQLCLENNITHTDIALKCNTLTAAEYSVINELSQYFPDLKTGTGQSFSNRWDGTISLAQQLIRCV